MATYRVRVPENGVEPARGQVNLDAWIDRWDEDLEEWVPIPRGHRTVELDADALLVIVNHPTATNAQKIAMLKALVVEEADQGGEVTKANEVYEALIDLAAPPYEFSVDL